MYKADLYITLASIAVTAIIAVMMVSSLIANPRSGFRRIMIATGFFAVFMGLAESMYLLIRMLMLPYTYEYIELGLIIAAFLVLAYISYKSLRYSRTHGFVNSEFKKGLENKDNKA